MKYEIGITDSKSICNGTAMLKKLIKMDKVVSILTEVKIWMRLRRLGEINF
jgi:hypothetical protein